MNNKVKQELERIEIPQELHKRSKFGIEQAKSEMKIKSKNKGRLLKGIGGMVAVAILSIGIIVAVNPTLASSIYGYFNDITNWKGAVVGLEYNEATEEIDVQIGELTLKNDQYVLPITTTYEYAEKHPFSIADALAIGNFKVISQTGGKISEEQIHVEPIIKEDFTFEIEDSDKLLSGAENNLQGKRSFQGNLILDKELLSSDEAYILSINSFFQHTKGEAPLEIKGEWQIKFSTN
ncbi:hypothetical protein GN156_14310 [bacterium LRH843]|nr:hypothetical protein [bacterium LRH843]